MVDPKKVRQMTKLAIMEKRQGTEMVRPISYRRIDYIFTAVFRGFIAGSVCYILGLVLWFCYIWEDLNEFMMGLDMMGLFRQLIIYYIIILAIYLGVCVLIAFRRYAKSMAFRTEYLNALKELKHSYDSDRIAEVWRRKTKEREENKRRGRQGRV